MSKVKDFWLWLTGALAAVAGLLWYFLSLKNREVAQLKTKINIADTKKKADLIETEIKQIRDQKQRTKTEIKKIDKVLEELDDKRKELDERHKKMSKEEILDFWNK